MAFTTSIPVIFVVVLAGGLFLLLQSKNFMLPVINLKNAWFAGGLLLMINTGIIGFTIFFAFKLVGSALILEIVSPLISIFIWLWIKSSLNGNLKERVISSILGQSVYIILFFICLYQYITLRPSYPGEDTFMAALGLILGMVVCFFAIIIGLGILLTPHKEKRRR